MVAYDSGADRTRTCGVTNERDGRRLVLPQPLDSLDLLLWAVDGTSCVWRSRSLLEGAVAA